MKGARIRYAALVPRASIYVHFPYCLAKCPYCDFVSYKKAKDDIDHAGYAGAVIREIDARAGSFEGREVHSVFFGGGTPSLWAKPDLGRVLAHLRARFSFADDVEITVECNPTSLDGAGAEALYDAGVNRLSIGTQSLDREELAYLGRLHDPAGALRALREALASRMPRVSADLIFGLPDQPVERGRDQAMALADLGLTHLSCYQLTIEPGTRFGELARAGRLPLADDGRVGEAFLLLDEALSARGFRHYEISNYALPGQEARHNLGYWRGEEYLGLGCGAFGFLRTGADGVRYRNEIDPERYLRHDGVPTKDEEPLSPLTLLRERIMLGLRLEGGFDLEAHARELGLEGFTPERSRAIEKLTTNGRLVREGDALRIPKPAWLFADDTAARLF